MHRAPDASDYWSFNLGSPASGSQLGQFSTESRIGVETDIGVMREVKNDAHEDAADRMNGLMAVESFVHQSVECVGTGVGSPSATWFSTTTWVIE